MKFGYLLFLSIITIYVANAQQDDSARSDILANNIYFNSTVVTVFDSGGMNGSVYLFDDWRSAFLIDENNTASKFFIKYNVLEDRIEFTQDITANEVQALVENDLTVVQIGERSFQFIDFNDQINSLSGYFEIIKKFDSNNILLKKFSKTLEKPSTLQTTGYSSSKSRKPSIKSSSQFYFVKDDIIVEIENNKKKSLSSLSDVNRDMLKDFIKENKIDFDEDGKGLAMLLDYYRTLK